MSYTHNNYYKKVIEIQNIVLREKKRGATQKWIYENLIKDKYHISKSTFNNYLALNAKAMLAKLQDTPKEDY